MDEKLRARFYSGPGTMPAWRADLWKGILETLEGIPEEQKSRITLSVQAAMERTFVEGAKASV